MPNATLAAFCLAVTTATASHATIVVDDFSTPQGPTSVAGEVTGSGILGGTRDYSPFTGSLDVSGGQAKLISEEIVPDDDTGATSTQAQAFLIYGSTDGTRDLNLDLSDPDIVFIINIASIGTPTDFPLFLNLRIRTAEGEQARVAQPEITQAGLFQVPIGDFFQGDANPADLTDIDLISFEFASSSIVADPITISSILIVPEPASALLLVALGLATTVARPRRSA
ncbi:MAG: PEP-CTERM sorting domain-containing protein [Planctomycetota bacterium]